MKQYYVTEYQDQRHSKVIAIPIFTDNYVYIFTDDSRRAFIVDPGLAEPVCSIVKSLSLNPTHVLITHSHLDHVGGVDEVIAQFPGIEKIDFSKCPKDENTFHLNDRTFRVFKTPGHLNDHICFFETQSETLFCGDILFRFGCGRIFVGSFEELFLSMQILKTIPAQALMFCTHEYTKANLEFCVAQGLVDPSSFSVEETSGVNKIPTLPTRFATELKYNPFLKAETLAEFTTLRKLRNTFRSEAN